MLTHWKENYEQPRQHIKKQRYYFANKGPSGQGYGFNSGCVWMWELDYKESWALKNWCFWTVVLEKTLEGPFDYKEIKQVHPKGDQSWVFIGGTDDEAETPVLWPPDVKNQLIGKYPDAGRGWGQEEKGTTEDEMAGWHHRLDGHEFGWIPGVGDGQGGLTCCGVRGRSTLRNPTCRFLLCALVLKGPVFLISSWKTGTEQSCRQFPGLRSWDREHAWMTFTLLWII